MGFLQYILRCSLNSADIDIMNMLQQYGYIRYTLDEKTKKLEYVITDWVVKCSGAECMSEAVYATDGYGFLCLPRSIMQRLAEQRCTFGESDAWLDLWCHTVWRDSGNAFSHLAPVIQFGKLGAALTLETLGQRWGWEKTKVWRFFQKHGDAFALYRLPGSYGCLIFNKLYPLDTEVSLPSHAEIERIIEEMRICAGNAHIAGSDNTRLNKMILWYSRILTGTIQGIERPADNPARSLAVIYHGDIKVIIPAEEAVEPPEDFRGRLPGDVLHYMVTKRLGAEVDYYHARD